MIIIVIHIIRCLVKGDKIMKLKEHLVARELAESEISISAREQFSSGL